MARGRQGGRVSGRGGNIGVSFDKNLAENLRQGSDIFMTTVRSGLQSVANDMQAWARANHKWQNRTGQAEATFTVTVVDLAIEAKHGVDYGKWLEWKYGGRDGVIPATMDYGKGKVRELMREAWSTAWRFQ